jgi:hypothetical protein
LALALATASSSALADQVYPLWFVGALTAVGFAILAAAGAVAGVICASRALDPRRVAGYAFFAIFLVDYLGVGVHAGEGDPPGLVVALIAVAMFGIPFALGVFGGRAWLVRKQNLATPPRAPAARARRWAEVAVLAITVAGAGAADWYRATGPRSARASVCGNFAVLEWRLERSGAEAARLLVKVRASHDAPARLAYASFNDERQLVGHSSPMFESPLVAVAAGEKTLELPVSRWGGPLVFADFAICPDADTFASCAWWGYGTPDVTEMSRPFCTKPIPPMPEKYEAFVAVPKGPS